MKPGRYLATQESITEKVFTIIKNQSDLLSPL